MSSSSSSEDEETLKLLQEAVDPTFLNKYTQKDNVNDTPKVTGCKSLRTAQDEDDQFNNLNVTPEFQKFVANKLTKLLDHKLSQTCTNAIHSDKIPKRRKAETDGVKLLKVSQVYLDADFVEKEPVHRKVQLERRKVDECNNLNEMDKVREAAVEPERILNGTETKHWAKLYTKPHFKYKKDKSGNLVLVD